MDSLSQNDRNWEQYFAFSLSGKGSETKASAKSTAEDAKDGSKSALSKTEDKAKVLFFFYNSPATPAAVFQQEQDGTASFLCNATALYKVKHVYGLNM